MFTYLKVFLPLIIEKWRAIVFIGLSVIILALVWLLHSIGVQAERKRWELKIAEAVDERRAAISDYVVQMSEKNTNLYLSLQTALSKQQEVTKVLIKDVPYYVSDTANNNCSIPVGFVQLHDAAANGVPTVPTAANAPADRVPKITLSDVSTTIITNYGQCNEWRERLIVWEKWFETNEAEWNKFSRQPKGKD